MGRISHPDIIGTLPVGPSAVQSNAQVYTPNGLSPVPIPHALTLDEIPGIVAQFRQGAANAKAAGFDGVEIHGANGYLLDQFLRDSSNQRTDAYGGSIANRARLPLEITDAVIGVWGADRVGYQVSPAFAYHSMADSQPMETFGHLALELSRRKLAYLHVTDSLIEIVSKACPRATCQFREGPSPGPGTSQRRLVTPRIPVSERPHVAGWGDEVRTPSAQTSARASSPPAL